MIGYLKGIVEYILPDSIILMCGGVGYKVEGVVQKKYIQKGAHIGFFIYTHVRENELKLFGFENELDLSIFELLIDVNGIGPKLALALISQLGGTAVVDSILDKDTEALRISGVGKKSADKIIIELHDRLESKGYSKSNKTSATIVEKKEFQDKIQQAKEALESLGYAPRDIQGLIQDLRKDPNLLAQDVSAIVKHMLKSM